MPMDTPVLLLGMEAKWRLRQQIPAVPVAAAARAVLRLLRKRFSIPGAQQPVRGFLPDRLFHFV